MNTKIQPTDDDDFASLASWISSSDDCLLWAGPAVRYPHSVEELKEDLTTEGTVSLSLKNERNELLGFGQIWSRNQLSAHLGRIIINPKLRKNGYGKKLIHSLIREARSKFDHDTITLKVYRRNRTASTIYKSLGFEEATEESNDESMLMKIQDKKAPQTTSASARV